MRRAHTYRKRRIVRYNLDGKEIEEIEEWQEENICFCCQLIFRILFISQGETLPYIYFFFNVWLVYKSLIIYIHMFFFFLSPSDETINRGLVFRNCHNLCMLNNPPVEFFKSRLLGAAAEV